MKKAVLLLSLTFATIHSYSQENSLKFSGYLEIYYSYDFNKPGDNNRPAFVYSHNIATGTPGGFQTTGYSLNIDYAPYSSSLIRLEGKVYDSQDRIFVRSGIPVDNNASLTASIAIAF